MRRHQMNAIWRGISERFMLLDHVVGAGKTFTAIAAPWNAGAWGCRASP
jgi:N12 class adenine-specific DNA methylase